MALGSKINQILDDPSKKSITTTTTTNSNTIVKKVHLLNEDQKEEEEDCNTCELLGVSDKKNQMFSMISSNSFSSNSNTSNKNKNIEKDTNDEADFWLPLDQPPTSVELGNSGWTLLHTMAAYYPEKPSETRKQDTLDFLTSFSKVYPCKVCAKDFREIIKETPPKLESQKDFALWLCDAHNSVNTQLGKPKFDCDLLNDRWKIGSKFH
ncbi:hypothetical protein DICPUDRAFT_150985 [Dictyostelium purpureum]|uniref:Sulfhydryl oxidase n=1 Tax=Dictyostelium purpureum TaxID=5786 RepID=F0ZHR0_DICPU|nr:uncharacterized protein DICPUDRAFT_150985 [Dictyostelium purpureum]EGC36505.1 hypothetical protein DICPUDRAFT_150985 [Dictyostelium purpureum]|eukprot:XP_003286950.1 hypothetical protein DICPUDRAFT_150985 [Dictyostelium purpureum]